jgi:asparagine synthase (glutamine-hydrolysing)
MPGVVGVIGPAAQAAGERTVASMLATMKHEPFYVSGTWSEPAQHAYVGWTAHPDSYAARQSANTDADVACAFAGECFESVESQCATIAERYQRRGDAFLADLNGIFGGALVDRRGRRTMVFTDRYGLERIYVHEARDATYFASEAKALLAVLPETRRFDEPGVAEYLTFGCCLDWKTLFRGIAVLEGGASLVFEAGRTRTVKYFDAAAWEAQATITEAAFEREFQETFARVMPMYCRGSEPLGIALTGGLDTRLIMASMPRLAQRPTCYTFAGRAGETRDDRTARAVARASDLEHTLIRLRPDFFARYGELVDRTAYLTDGTAGAMTAHEVYFNAAARTLAPVRLTGNFGSEILRGAGGIKAAGLDDNLFSNDYRPTLDDMQRRVVHRRRHAAGAAAFEDVPWRLFGSCAAGRTQVTFRTPYLDNELVALAHRAPASALSSPDPALRYVAARSPGLSRIPTDRSLLVDQGGLARLGPRVVSEVTFKLDYLFTEGMPHLGSLVDSFARPLTAIGVLGQHKYLNYRRWYRDELRGAVGDVLGDARTSRMPFWNRTLLSTMADDHVRGRRNYVREIDTVMTLEAVDRLLVGMSGAPGR